MQNRPLDYTRRPTRKKTQNGSGTCKTYEEATKRHAKKLRGGHPLIWNRFIERDLNSINSTTKDAIIKAHDKENYHNNIMTCVKAIESNRRTIS